MLDSLADDLFDTSQVLDVKIEIATEDWDKLRMQGRVFAEALGKTPAKRPYTYFRGTATVNGVRIEDVGIRKKGFIGSLDEERPSLKIKFAEYKQQSPFKGIDRLTLNNDKQDRTHLYQFLAFKFFNETGTRASRCNHAHVTVNGVSLGIYSHVESVKPPMLAREFGVGTGALFEGTVADLFPDTLRKFEKKNKQAKRSQLKPLAEILARDDLDLKALEQQLDVKAFLKFWATESLLGFWDSYSQNQNNFFMYRAPSNGKFYFIPWGTDTAFSSSMPLPPYVISNKSVQANAVIPNRLYRDPRTREQYHASFRKLLKERWKEEELLKEIDRVEVLLKPHLHQRQKDFPLSLNKLRYFIKNRRKVLENDMKKWPLKITTKAREPSYFKQIGTAKIKFDTKWFDKSPFQVFSAGKAEVELTLEGQPVTFTKIGAVAEPGKMSPKESDGNKPPSIVIHGQRKSDGKHIIIGVGLSGDQFRPSHTKQVSVQGLMMEGAFGFLNPKTMRFLSGKMTLTQAERKAGAPVSGEMQLTLVKIKGGEPRK